MKIMMGLLKDRVVRRRVEIVISVQTIKEIEEKKDLDLEQEEGDRKYLWCYGL